MSKLRNLARGQPCQIRLRGICTHDSEETVLAHVRMTGITGASQKAPDILGAWSCYACHQATENAKADDFLQRCFLEGVIRTQYQLIRRGILPK